jgi:hypothetical protein
LACQYNPKLALPANSKKAVYGITIQSQGKVKELPMKFGKWKGLKGG